MTYVNKSIPVPYLPTNCSPVGRATSHIRGTLYAIGDTKYELKDNAV